MSEISNELELLGDALQRAWRKQYAQAQANRSSRRVRRAPVVLAAAAVLVAAGAAIAGTVLKTASQAEQGMLDGYRLFAGTDPSCRQRSATSFHCFLDRPPREITFYDADGHLLPDAYLGLKAETVDPNKRVDGACTSLSKDGRSWDCYLGEEAIARGLLRRERLGAYVPEPPTA